MSLSSPHENSLYFSSVNATDYSEHKISPSLYNVSNNIETNSNSNSNNGNNNNNNNNDMLLLGDILNENNINNNTHTHTHTYTYTTQPSFKHKTKPKNDNTETKENYIDILISAAMNLINNHNISQSYLSNESRSQFSEENDDNNISLKSTSEHVNVSNSSSSNSQLIKCKNALCTNYINIYSMSIYCKECDVDYVKGNYCYYCKRLYSTRHSKYINSEWVECYYCNKHNHIQCEMESGNYVNISKMVLHKGFKYMCPQCRKNKQKKRGNNSNVIKKNEGELSNNNNKTKKMKCDNKEMCLDYVKIMKIVKGD